MGGCCCCCCGGGFTPSSVRGQGASVLTLCKKLGLTQEDLDCLWRAFNTMDKNKGGSIDIDEFIVMTRLDHSETFAKVAFRIMDKDLSGQLDFDEFVCAVWNIASADHTNLALFAHRLFDFDDSGSLDSDEITFVANLFWDFRPPPHVLTAMGHWDHDHSGEVTQREFVVAIKNAEMILQPVFEVGHFLQVSTLGKPRWLTLTDQRSKQFGIKTIWEILGNSFRQEQTSKCAALHVATKYFGRAPDVMQKKLRHSEEVYNHMKQEGIKQMTDHHEGESRNLKGNNRSKADAGGQTSSSHGSHGHGHSSSRDGHGHGGSQTSSSHGSHGHGHDHGGHQTSSSHGSHSHSHSSHDLLDSFTKDAVRAHNEGTLGVGKTAVTNTHGTFGRVHSDFGAAEVGHHHKLDADHLNTRVDLSHKEKASPDSHVQHAWTNRTSSAVAIKEALAGTAHVYDQSPVDHHDDRHAKKSKGHSHGHH